MNDISLKDYMNEKFGEVHEKLDKLDQETNSNSRYIWIAIGALGIISTVAVVFANYFRLLNAEQIRQANGPISSKIETIGNQVTVQGIDIQTIKDTLSSYDIKIR